MKKKKRNVQKWHKNNLFWFNLFINISSLFPDIEIYKWDDSISKRKADHFSHSPPNSQFISTCFCLCVRVTIIRKSLIWNIHTLTILTYMVHYNLICCNSQTNYFIFLLCKIKKNCICNFQYLENSQWFQNIFFSKNPNLKKKFHK